MGSKYLLFVIPKSGRFPRLWTDWLRLTLAIVLVVVAGLTFWRGPWLSDRLGCRDGFPSGDIWESGGECVGLSSGPYAFDQAVFAPVLAVIDRQNQQAAEKCDPNGTPVTVGVLMTMTDQQVGGRALHELEGMAAGQRKANNTGCLHPVRLVVGQTGKGGLAAVELATRMAKRPDVVAVAGLGLSDQNSADAAQVLADAHIPAVADLITAEGFDQNGSAQDHPDFSSCDSDITYTQGVGKDWFYRVSFRNSVQIGELAKVTGQPDFIMVPAGGADPYTCTTLPLIQRQFGGNITEVTFDPDESSTVPQTAKRVCNVPGEVSMIYIARGRDLGRFLYSLDEAWSNGQCAASSITVLSTSDASRLRAPEPDSTLEDLRTRALGSKTFTSGAVSLLYTPLAASDHLRKTSRNFATFEQAFTEAGFDMSHVDDGWAISAYDAMTTIATALRTLPAGEPVASSAVNTVISGFSSATQSVPGAGGSITFDNNGNRSDTRPVVIRLCPLPQAEARTTSVTVRPGQAAACGG
jgi:ABC-type branched-subunit amino acid transport system substrate-binding protein